ncbi:hypothetical protein A2U01_0088888, partial [Trifolium medium]|nr:hypothetical protein [Trifolium medium]
NSTSEGGGEDREAEVAGPPKLVGRAVTTDGGPTAVRRWSGGGLVVVRWWSSG